MKLDIQLRPNLSTERYYDHLLEISVTLVDDTFYPQDDKVIGKLSLSKFNWHQRYQDEFDLLAIADDFVELSRIVEILTDGFQTFRPKDWKAMGKTTPNYPCRFMVLDAIYLDPEYQGRKLGLEAIQRLWEIFGNDCEFLATEAIPLQFSPDYDFLPKDAKLSHLPKEKQLAREKLVGHYQSIGFKQFPNPEGLDIMVLTH